MILALRTGWTPEVIGGDRGGVSDAFRKAAHWALYAETVIGKDWPPDADEPPATEGAAREAARAARRRVRAWLTSVRAVLFPAD